MHIQEKIEDGILHLIKDNSKLEINVLSIGKNIYKITRIYLQN